MHRNLRNSESEKVANLFGVPIQKATMDDVLRRARGAIESRSAFNIGVVNAAKIVNMRRDPQLSKAVLDSDAIYADGMSVVWASRILGNRIPERVAGIDLMHCLMVRANLHKYRVFCLGATQKVLATVCLRFSEIYPDAVMVGTHHGYFGSNEEENVARQIKNSRADILFVAITSPKKEQFMARHAETMGVPVVHGVGGSFDVVAGLVKRAPTSWQRLGLEWLYRVKQEPGRLWRRYLTTNLAFSGLVVREWWVQRRCHLAKRQ